MFLKPSEQDLKILVQLASEVESHLNEQDSQKGYSACGGGSDPYVYLGGTPGEILRRFRSHVQPVLTTRSYEFRTEMKLATPQQERKVSGEYEVDSLKSAGSTPGKTIAKS